MQISCVHVCVFAYAHVCMREADQKKDNLECGSSDVIHLVFFFFKTESLTCSKAH